MGFKLKRLVKSAKKTVKKVSKIAGTALKYTTPIVAAGLAATGVGTPLAIGLVAAGGTIGGSVLSGGNKKKKLTNLKRGAIGAAAGVGAGIAIGAAFPGLGTALGVAGAHSVNPMSPGSPSGEVGSVVQAGSTSDGGFDRYDAAGNFLEHVGPSGGGSFLSGALAGIGNSVTGLIGSAGAAAQNALADAFRNPNQGQNTDASQNGSQEQRGRGSDSDKAGGSITDEKWFYPVVIGVAGLALLMLLKK